MDLLLWYGNKTTDFYSTVVLSHGLFQKMRYMPFFKWLRHCRTLNIRLGTREGTFDTLGYNDSEFFGAQIIYLYGHILVFLHPMK